jgi:DNA-binding beta-propeller fold protein YncE
VATPADRTVHRIDTGAGREIEPIKLPATPGQAAYGDGAVWVTSATGSAVMRIDAATSKWVTIPVGTGPSGIAFGADRVWVANGLDGTVSTIDPQTSEVGTRRLGFRPPSPGLAEQRAVWVALAGDEVARSVAGRERGCRSDQEPSPRIRSVVGTQPATSG